MRALLAVGSALCLSLLAVAPAQAALTASELALDGAILNQFNAVAFGNYTMGNETEGRIAVGGNLTAGGGNICFNGCPGDTTNTALGATPYGSLTVWGNVTGSGAQAGGGDFSIQGSNGSGSTLNMNSHGGVSVGQGNSGTIQGATFVRTAATSAGTVTNSPTPSSPGITTGLPLTTVFPYGSTMPFRAALTDLATGIAGAAAATTAQTLGTYVQNGATGLTATAAPGSYGGKAYGFVTTTLAALASYQNFSGITNSGLDAVFVVVTGTSGPALPNMNAATNANLVVWDFVDATSVSFAGSWYGQVLAPNATVSNPSSPLNGTVIADAIVQGAEFHQYSGTDLLPPGSLSGLPVTTPAGGTPVPEPPAAALLLVGVAALLLLRRRAAPG